MLAIVARNRFSKEFALMVKRGKDGNKLKAVITLLANGATLPSEYKDHPLKGNFKGCRDCHVEPDWLLIYRRDTETLYLERTGTHSDLFE
jgi:mRNA interferase YafQ